ncbi:hypothetical protein EPD60_10585 [Flaviaesturariibacter flavus]|uniref:DUF4160 domain-containing protein n=1 Tax=Flaviaesturariibacter flavus TaxID=2502780 RepID=A0A4R1BBV8_9BACT|nr:hypothetical protein [Flaviaesturariibacter flavus]TCJ14428.1 hypothetical protein EPD60_10585 [Flaviaesturariibacter flavus]
MQFSQEERFEQQIGGRRYLFIRMYHPDLPLTYHIHTEVGHRRQVFRLQRVQEEWKILSSAQVPGFAYIDREQLVAAILDYEKRRT